MKNENVLYKGIDFETFYNEILKKDLKIKNNGKYNSLIRKLITNNSVISVSRNFDFAKQYGGIICEFKKDLLKYKYKIIPFNENLEFFYYIIHNNIIENFSNKNLKKYINDKNLGKYLWNFKTNEYNSDFNISEELIIAKEIDIKYINKIYIRTDKHSKIETINYENLIKEIILNNIPYEEIKEKNVLFFNI